MCRWSVAERWGRGRDVRPARVTVRMVSGLGVGEAGWAGWGGGSGVGATSRSKSVSDCTAEGRMGTRRWATAGNRVDD